MMTLIYLCLRRHYPNFQDLLNSIPDHRKRSHFQICELLMAGLCVHIFKCGTRNKTDLMVTRTFEENYLRIFGLRIPIMDTVDAFLRELDPSELESIKVLMIRCLIDKKVFVKWKMNGRYMVAVDGTGLGSYPYQPYQGCPYKRSKNGVTTWTPYVLEAKLICNNGFSISLASCWLDNQESLNEKQDCEQKAFKRLSAKLKELYPRLPIILLADALYASRVMMSISKKNDWRYIINFKEGSLPTVWEEVTSLCPLTQTQSDQRFVIKGKQHYKQQVRFINDLEYKGEKLSWVEYMENCTAEDAKALKFCYISDMKMDIQAAWALVDAGRQRWKIENQGFNTQKNQGYNLEHKISRKHFNAKKNYYELLQIAHLINQLAEKLLYLKEQLRICKTTIAVVFEDMRAYMRSAIPEEKMLDKELVKFKQLRY